MSRLAELYDVWGQSFWYDNIRRELLETGELKRMVEQDGLRGLTSNPTIFERAAASGHAYDAELARLLPGRSAEKAALELMRLDIRAAADVLRPVFDRTAGADGFACLEVSPALAHDAAGQLAMARRLFRELDRPNVMVKIPGTAEGVPAIEASLAEGINVNVTLLFSLAGYEAVAEAYLRGLERCPGDLSRGPSSVASFFVSRVDAAVDRELAPDSPLRGRVGIANARIAYARFREIFSGPRWEALVRRGASVQRPLWASTSPKDPRYVPTMYLDALLARDTVITMPDSLIDAIRKRGDIPRPHPWDLAAERAILAAVPGLEATLARLQEEGIQAFQASWSTLVRSLERKRPLAA